MTFFMYDTDYTEEEVWVGIRKLLKALSDSNPDGPAPSLNMPHKIATELGIFTVTFERMK